jgi:hypothetical protein
MKIERSIWAIALAVALLAGCAALQGLPQGSVLVGDYEGSFEGKFSWGTIGVNVYEAPGGARPVLGYLQQTAQQSLLNFHGELKASRVEAEFAFVYGGITGELSPDGRTMSGTYKITDAPFDQGTWKAAKR